MKQRYLIFIAVAILSILVILISLLTNKSFTGSTKTTIQNISITPVEQRSGSGQYTTPTVSNNKSTSQNNTLNKNGAPSSNSSPMSPTLSPPAQKSLSNFSSSLNLLYGNPDNQKTVVNKTKPIYNDSKKNIGFTPTPTIDPLKTFVSAINLLFSFSTTNPTSTEPQTQSGEQNTVSSSTPIDKVYYPQCNGPYDNDPMPNGCNICAAGCGPASVAMILSSYVDTKYDPPTVANLYGQSGFEAGCKGTTIVDAQQILNQNGIKTTDINYYGDSSFDETVQDFKQYLNNGWTLLTLVKYGPNWGHFYWVVSVDENNNIWAYDPGDAKRPVPLNENTVEPTAKYYLAIGVKKS